jgi:predicted amidophosphoribosyltransferase
MPLIITQFLNYAVKLYPNNNVHVEVLLLTLVAATPILNTLTRILCDAQLKKKFMCKKKVNNNKRRVIY